MSSVPPARSIRVGARASIRNFAHLFLILFPTATRAIAATSLAGSARSVRRACFPRLSKTFRKMENMIQIARACRSRIANHSIGGNTGIDQLPSTQPKSQEVLERFMLGLPGRELSEELT